MISRVYPCSVYTLTSVTLVAIKVLPIRIACKIFLIIDWKPASKGFKISSLEWRNLEDYNRANLEECSKTVTRLPGG